MSQSLSKILVHLIFSTKNRRKILEASIRADLNSYMAGILQEWGSPAVIVASVADHAHLLLCLSKNHALSKVVEQVKKGSSKWIKTQGKRYSDFQWQSGYGAFSVSQSNVSRVKIYIANQEEHHRRRSFEDEFRALRRRHQRPRAVPWAVMLQALRADRAKPAVDSVIRFRLGSVFSISTALTYVGRYPMFWSCIPSSIWRRRGKNGWLKSSRRGVGRHLSRI